ncbi:protein of unknown function [Burkholderia multivorans]
MRTNIPFDIHTFLSFLTALRRRRETFPHRHVSLYITNRLLFRHMWRATPRDPDSPAGTRFVTI